MTSDTKIDNISSNYRCFILVGLGHQYPCTKKFRICLMHLINYPHFNMKFSWLFHVPSFIPFRSSASPALTSSYHTDITPEHVFGLTSSGMTWVWRFSKVSAQCFEREHAADNLQWSRTYLVGYSLTKVSCVVSESPWRQRLQRKPKRRNNFKIRCS